MTQNFLQPGELSIRSIHYGDLETIDQCCTPDVEEKLSYSINPENSPKSLVTWSGITRALSALINRPHIFGVFHSERENRLQGAIQISPFNRTRSTWRVDRVAVAKLTDQASSKNISTGNGVETSEKSQLSTPTLTPILSDVGSLLLRYCFETIWEARTWLLEVNVNDKELLALYRQNGFQPLANMTYWEIGFDQLAELAEREPDLPNLLPVSNADAQLLYQLDTMSMPPLVRQVFDRHTADFRTSLFHSLVRGIRNWLHHTEVVSGYVFELQRKAAIGYFQIQLCRDGSTPHQAQLTVNPAYTWLYPELMSQMARIAQDFPAQTLRLVSSDYQPEREEYLQGLGATRIAHTLMMSRSVWHKVRETKIGAFENLQQIPEVLQGLKPSRKAIPSRVSGVEPLSRKPHPGVKQSHSSFSKLSKTRKSMFKSSSKTDFSDPPPQGPCY